MRSLLLLGLCVMAAAQHDARAQWPLCQTSFQITDQGPCGTCCAMALASVLSVRECISNGRDMLYSAQQIWDCNGPASLASCAGGSILQNLLTSMGTGANTAQCLVPASAAPYTHSEPSGCTIMNNTVLCLCMLGLCMLHAKTVHVGRASGPSWTAWSPSICNGFTTTAALAP